MKLSMLAGLALILSCVAVSPVRSGEEPATLKQPVFLLCPHREHFGAWSIYVVVDKSDPSKILSIGLEELVNKNGKDDGYENVLKAQRDEKTERAPVATLDAKSFSGGTLRVEKDRALDVSLTPDGADYKLGISLRINANERFAMGGEGGASRQLILRYGKGLQRWRAYATALENVDGRNIVSGEPLAVTGLAFPVSGTGIFRIAVVLAGGGTPVMVMDKN